MAVRVFKPATTVKGKLLNICEKMIFNFAKRYQRKKIYPATVICANYNREFVIDKSGAVPINLANQLKIQLSTLGTIGERNSSGNFIGRCSEVRASNPILNHNPHLRTQQVHFSNAYRPRTMQMIPTCSNCTRTF
ncbi:hypothetical protein [Sulfurimonas microaerophilic]|uniref:hypothetical protein n=1 Tax=Sulfurimonas microaerophilic TaxID=3058392 RepID=UPI002714CBA1|nr:hypothetical protein [Sulfurimonas sp. hsl 1-7]